MAKLYAETGDVTFSNTELTQDTRGEAEILELKSKISFGHSVYIIKHWLIKIRINSSKN